MMDIAESKVTQTHEKCLHATGALLIWAGITDQYEEDTWVNPYTMGPSGLTVWQPGRPNGGPIRNCARTYLGNYLMIDDLLLNHQIMIFEFGICCLHENDTAKCIIKISNYIYDY